MQTQIKPSSFRSASFIPAALAAVLTLALAPATRAHPSADSRIYAPTAKPFGKSYATWSAQWWKWALARPVEGHPFSNRPSQRALADRGKKSNAIA